MTLPELHERLQSWLWLYSQVPFPPSTDPKVIDFNEFVSEKWVNERIAEVSLFEMPAELIGSPVGKNLQYAIECAKSMNGEDLKNIHDNLLRVINYIIDNRLILKDIQPN